MNYSNLNADCNPAQGRATRLASSVEQQNAVVGVGRCKSNVSVG
jgi:hypothetical protein